MKIVVNGHNTIEMDIPFTYFQTNERLKRSLKTFGVFFGLAIAAVFIPVLHFFLVPLFLLLSIVFSILKYKEVGMIDLSRFNCPSCHKPLNEKIFAFKENDTSIQRHCYECRKSVLFLLNEARLSSN